MTELFSARCVAPDGGETTLRAAVDADKFTLGIGQGDDDSKSFALTHASGDLASGFEARLDLQPEENRSFAEVGMIGLVPAGGARLEAVRIAVRPAERPGGHSSEHPYFALYLDWSISAEVDGGSQFGELDVEAGAQAELILTTGFSTIHPPALTMQLGSSALQVRLDLDFLAATTGWIPLAMIEGGLGSPFEMPGLLEWFRRLIGQGGGAPLADWSADLRLDAALPLGIRFERSYLALAREEGAYRLEARASGLVLAWEGDDVFHYQDAEFFLTFADGRYIFKAVLFAAQYPKPDAAGSLPPWKVELPFGTLALQAEAWRITGGLIAARRGNGAIRVCPELIVEMAGASLSSELWGGGEPIWSASAARLHLRGLRVLTCSVPGGKLLFGDVQAGNWLRSYRDLHQPSVDKLSGVASAGQPDSQDSFPVEFLDGSFDRESHLFLLWKQDNAALFERLARIVPGLTCQQSASDADPLIVAFELSRFASPAGRDLQARLEWQAPPPALDAAPIAAAPPVTAPLLPDVLAEEICARVVDGNVLFNLPPGTATPPKPIEDRDLRLDLPLLEVAIARPASRSLLFYRPAGQRPVLSLLHIYRKPAGEAVQPILYAAIDLSLEHGGERDLLPTGGSEDPPFIAMGLGSTEAEKALAVIAWTQGQRPQIMRSFETGSAPFRSLIPSELPSGEEDCSGCPEPAAARPAPLALRPDRFGSPQMASAASGWTLAIQVAAERALKSFLPQPDSADSLVKLDVEKVCYVPEDGGGSAFLPPLRIHASLTIKLDFDGAGDNKVTGEAVFRFDPSDMSLRLVEGGVLDFELDLGNTPSWAAELGFPIEPVEHHYSKSISLFGLEAIFYRKTAEDGSKSRKFLTLDLRRGRFAIGLSEGSHCILRYADLGGGALTFNVSDFLLGSGGLDLEAALVPAPLKVKGLSNPFRLASAQLSMAGSRMRRLSVSGSGKMPEILSYAPVSVTLTLAQAKAGGAIDLEELSCLLERADEPIFTSGIRYRFEITALSLRYAREAAGSGGRHFFFEVSGSAQFQPEKREFDGGLLENLKSARVEFTRAPLSDEFTDHLAFIVELNEPVTFKVFNLFRMEIRSFGFAPKHDFPTPRPALIIGGQCEFADAGDMISAEIDFHRMYLGLPAQGETMPQVEFKNLRVEIRSAEGFRIGGTVAPYDEKDRKGFAGDGFIAIPGFPQLGAAFSFLKLRKPDGPWKRAWFIALEASAISYPIGSLPIYLRQVGLGFGYRMTSVLLREQPERQTLPDLVDYLLSALEQHQTLARIESWVEDLEDRGSARWTVAMEAVLTLGTTQGDPFNYEAEAERKLRTIVLQMLAAMRSDLTLAAGAKLWFPVSYDDFLNDRLAMRSRPLAKGFIHYAPRQQRLLAYARKEKDAYYGDPDDPLTQFVQTVLEPTPFECITLIEPSRVRGEIGWADRLVFPIKLGPLKLECRGGILFAVEKGAAIYGLYFSARGEMSMSGSAGGGSLGLRLSAHVKVHFATRLMMARPLLLPVPSHIYGQVGIDISIRFSVEAWFKFKVGFVKVRLSISFSVDLQVLVALEIGLADHTSMGFKGRATVMIGVFGRRLRASVAVGINEGGVVRARAHLQDYMSSLLEPGKVPPVPGESEVRALPLGATYEAAATSALLAAEEEVPPEQHTEPFAFAVIPLGARSGPPGAERDWLLWIMPTPAADGFYPVPEGAPQEKDEELWATISSIPTGARLFSLQGGGWKEAEGGKLDLFCRPGKAFTLEEEGGAQVGKDDELTLRKAIAGCYCPKIPENFPNFPFDFHGSGSVLDCVPSDRDLPILEDERVYEGPRHVDPVLNPANPYDAALASAVTEADDFPEDTPEARMARLVKQAQGNQAFLLRSFQDDIDAYAVRSGSAAARDQTRGHDMLLGLAKPSIWDTGMVLLLKAAQLPDWARLRDGDPPQPARPVLTFKVSGSHTRAGSLHKLQPMVEPEAALLSGGNAALTGRAVAHFDENLLAISWKLDWSSKAPSAAPGIGREVHDFLRHYRIDLYDLGGEGSNSLAQRLVLPANLRAKQGQGDNGASVELKPHYNFTIPVSEMFPKGRAGGQEPRRVLAVITPVGQAGEEGDPFSITAVEEPRLTPLPADGAELILEMPASGPLIATLSWEEPALPNRAGIADTDEWQLILRRLPHVPLGHYPQVAEGDAGDESGQMAFDRTVRPGDLILRMPKAAFERLKSGGASVVPRERAHFRFEEGALHYTLDLHSPLKNPRFTWVDDEGRPVFGPGSPSARLQELVESFRGGKSAAEEDGQAWQILIRARSNRGADPESGPTTYSSIAPVRMKAILGKADPSARADGTPRQAPRALPLQHFEWPRRVKTALAAPQVLAGNLHVPLARLGEGKADIAYCPSGDDRRVVSASWTGFADAESGKRWALAACAGFRLSERIEDGRTNQQVHDGFEAIEIATFDAADPALAAASPGTLSETQNWQGWGPAQDSLLTWNAAVGDKPPLIPDARRSWYSWTDADLLWPTRAWHPPGTDRAELSDEKKPKTQLPRENLHPLLAELLLRLERDWADPTGIVVEAAAGRPDVKAPSRGQWMDRNSEALDPYGWAALWHLGLAFELSARDAVSGMPVPQARLREQCEVILRELFAGENGPHELAPHVMLDCPVRPNAGLAGGPSRAQLDEISLDRVQLALRPCIAPRESYIVIEVAPDHRREKGGQEHRSAAVGTGVPGLYCLVQNDGPERIVFIPFDGENSHAVASRLRELMSPGAKLLLKFPAKPEARARKLEEVVRSVAPTFVRVDRPLSIGGASSGVPIWPHGRFRDDHRLSPPDPEQERRFLDYLEAAPLPDQKPGGGATSRTEWPDIEDEKDQLLRLYPDWARRFFASAPMPGGSAEVFSFSRANVTIAAPRSEATDILGPGRDGSYRFNRPVNWQWATVRSITVDAIGRYERLLDAMEAGLSGSIPDERPAAKAEAAFTPFYLPRIRKVEPPQLLGERIIRADDGRDHHELTIAIHDEDALQQANVRLARQLEFIGSRMRYRRDFRDLDWAEKISIRLAEAAPRMSSPDLDWGKVPRFSQGDASFLNAAPAARFGATALITPCEPFFYGTVLEIQAIAAPAREEARSAGGAAAVVEVRSPVVVRPLAYAPAGATDPRDGSPLELEVEPWEEGIALDHARWISALAEGNEQVIRGLGRSSLRARVRYPRYFESLPESQDSVEGAPDSVGTLPDFEAAVHLTRRVTQADEPICVIRTDASEGTTPFSVVSVSPDVDIADVQIGLDPTWSEGVWIKAALRLKLAPPPAAVGYERMVAARLPAAEAERDALFEPARLPAWGPLAGAAPLALRLQIYSPEEAQAPEIIFVDPFPVARFMARPLTADKNRLGAEPGDLARGLRLLLDVERMTAAKAALYLSPAGAPFELRRLIEEAAGAACRRRPAEGVPAGEWETWTPHLRLWGLSEQAGGVAEWVPIVEPPGGGVDFIIAITESWTGKSAAAFEAFLTLEMLAGAAGLDVATIKKIDALSETLAKPLEEQVEKSRGIELRGASITAWVQRGNAQRTYWAGRQPHA